MTQLVEPMLTFTQPVITRTPDHQYGLGEHGPYPGVTAICGFHDAVGGSNGLVNWTANTVLTAYQEALDATGSPEEARRAAWEAKDQARQIGTAVHAAVDQVNKGQKLFVTDRVAPYLAQYGAFAVKHNLRVISSEFMVINTAIGYGGTGDLLAEVDGQTALLDVKSGKAKPSQRLQLTGLSMGELMYDGSADPAPLPEIEAAYILLLRPDGFEPIRHEITEADREHFVGLVKTYRSVWQWRSQDAA